MRSAIVNEQALWLINTVMRCPECLEKIHDHAEECPHCGMTLERLSQNYQGINTTVNDGVHDDAGVLSIEMRKKMKHAIQLCEKQFVGVSIAVSLVALKDNQTITGYGLWLHNNGQFFRNHIEHSDPADGRGRVILVLDAKEKHIALSYGYYFDGHIRDKENFDILSAGHASLLEGNIVLGCEQILKALRQTLKKAITRSIKKQRKS